MKRPTFTIANIGRALWLGLALLCAQPRANAAGERQDELKAAFLFNFMNFIEWPGTAPDDIINVCFLGGGGVYDAFTAGIRRKRVGNHPLASRQLGAHEQVAGCSVLYIDAETIAVNGGRVPDGFIPAVLTVSDARQFVRDGGIIELFTERNRLRFNVNLQNAQKGGLRISSSLLELAAFVDRGDRR
jgi:hypothetical protein